MSYSRWSNSVWYTYWAAVSPADNQDINKQIFEICDLARSQRFTYKEINEDLTACLNTVKNLWASSVTGSLTKLDTLFSNGPTEYEEVVYNPAPLTQETVDELKGYMLEFIKDVQEEWLKECPKGTHDCLDDALGCWRCQNASLRQRKEK
jgi:hypothetical protein